MTILINPKHSFNYDGVTLNIYHANKNEGLPKHEHKFSHATMCNAGSCKVSLENRHYIIDNNSNPLNLPENEWHEIEALEDGTVFVNVFAEGKY
jgi:quercetin dioxygenase-like cupin family protein